MFRAFLAHHLLKAVVFALIALVLYGTLPSTSLVAILVLFVLMRSGFLGVEAFRKPVGITAWEAMTRDLTGFYERLSPEQRATEAVTLKLDLHSTPRELAETQVREALRRYAPPRTKLELGAEAFGLIGFVLLMPIDAALYTSDFVSPRRFQNWTGCALVLLGVALYAWPHLRPGFVLTAKRRILWWAVPFLPTLLLFLAGIGIRHPYLNPFHPEHTRLAADRVLALSDVVVAGSHADWVMRYARELDARGETSLAIHYYREALRLDSNDANAHARLAILEAESSVIGAPDSTMVSGDPLAPYWTTWQLVLPSERCVIDRNLDRVAGCTVVLVAVGQVPDRMMDAAAWVIREELKLPVCVADLVVPVPPHTRVKGLLTGRQWACDELVKALQRAVKTFPDAPVKYLLVTPVDIYTGDANYVFSGSYNFGAVVSFARYGNSKNVDDVLVQRTAKQALCALIKSFPVPTCPRRECVTSYTRSLAEFDAKGNRPCAETLAAFRRSVDEMNERWRKHKG
jgi:predicted Zn-dependent protease